MKLHYADGAQRSLAAMADRAAAGPVPGTIVFLLIFAL